MQTEEFPALGQRRRSSSFDRAGGLDQVEESEDEEVDAETEDDDAGEGEESNLKGLGENDGDLGRKYNDARGLANRLSSTCKGDGLEAVLSLQASKLSFGTGASINASKSFSVYSTGKNGRISEEGEEDEDEADESTEHAEQRVQAYGLGLSGEETNEDEEDGEEEESKLGHLPPFEGRRSALQETIMAGSLGVPRGTDLTLISLNQYILQQELGRGSQAIVYRAKDRHTNQEVAFRIVQGVRLRDVVQAESEELSRGLRMNGSVATMTKAIKTELAILQRIEHPNLVSFIEVLDLETFDDTVRGVAIAMELASGRELVSDEKLEALDADFWDMHTTASAQPLFSERECCRVFSQILAGLEYMHYHGIFHGDVKPSNVIYNETTGHVKLVDFGVSRAATFEQTAIDLGPTIFRSHGGFGRGTLLFFSPEAFNLAPGATFDAADADVWAASMTLYVLLFGHLPLRGITERGDLMHLMQTAKALPLWEPEMLGIVSTTTSRGGAAVCHECLRIDRFARVKQISKIMQHPWMRPAQETFRASNGALRANSPLGKQLSDDDLDSVGAPVTEVTGWASFKRRFVQIESSFKTFTCSAIARLSDLGENLARESRLSDLHDEGCQQVKRVQAKLERAAIRIQTMFRMHAARCLARRLRLQKSLNFAATKIQTVFRSRQARQQAEAMRKSKAQAASMASTINSELHSAARSIQGMYRRRLRRQFTNSGDAQRSLVQARKPSSSSS